MSDRSPIIGSPTKTLRIVIPEVHFLIENMNNGEHETDPSCWCRPQLTHDDPVTETQVWTHKEVVE